ncbi:hypothetical protein AAVH_36590 [Aphelenchoides avenae]|nr:hypothetical protein AAVH_36590 [Aphelenchus avenae]
MNATAPTTICSHCTRPKSVQKSAEAVNEKTQDSFEEHRTKRHNRKEVKASGESMKPAAASGEVINLSGEAKAEDPKPPVTYARNDQPFVKVLATPKGQPSPAMVLPPRTAPDGDKSVDQGTRNETSDAGASSSPYRPAKAYTIQEVGGQKKIIYHPTGKPFIKTINAGPGQPQYALVCPPRGPGDAASQGSPSGFRPQSDLQSKR